MPPDQQPERDAPVLLSLKCEACRERDQAERRGLKGTRPGRRCPKCRRSWAKGHGPGSGGEVDPGPPDVDGPV